MRIELNNMQRFIFFSFLIIGFCSCKNEKSLIGNWKTTKVSFHDIKSKSTFTIYDRNNEDSIKENLVQKYLNQSSSDSNEYGNNTTELRKELDKDFLKFKNSNLILETDSTFYMQSFGLIVPRTEPGWHFGDTLSGKWSHNNNMTLKLQLGDITISHPFFFKITKLTYDSLAISMTDESYGDPFVDIEFARQ